jgi:hypothetical protein
LAGYRLLWLEGGLSEVSKVIKRIDVDMTSLHGHLIAYPGRLTTYEQKAYASDAFVMMVCCLFDFALEVLTFNKIWDLIIVIVSFLLFTTLLFLQALIRFSQSPQASQRVGTELVEDARDELSELLVFTVAVNCEGVGRNGSVNCG